MKTDTNIQGGRTMNTEKTPIELMGELFAQMTLRAMDAEKKEADARKEATDWYQRWKDTDAKLTETATKLTETEKKLEGCFKKVIELQKALKKATGAHESASEPRNDREGTETHPSTENAQDSATNAEKIQTEGEQHGTL